MMTKELDFKTRIDVSKELEIINFRLFQQDDVRTTEPGWKINRWMQDGEMKNKSIKEKEKSIVLNRPNQYTSFQEAMKILLVVGQLVGLNPVSGILENNISKSRFTVCSLKFLYSIFLSTIQIIATFLYSIKMFTKTITIVILGNFSFYFATASTTLIFIRIATKWPNLMKELFHSNLDSYIDSRIRKTCTMVCVLFITVTIVEHVLALISETSRAIDCQLDYFSEVLAKISIKHMNTSRTYIKTVGSLIKIHNVMATINWNYSDMFIICISLYLTSILDQINKKIFLASKQVYLPSSVWASLREDYTRATRLVQLFDDSFSCVILISFASNLFFICLQLFNILVIGPNVLIQSCPNYPSGPFYGYEHQIYVTFSVTYLICRFLAVTLVGSRIHSVALLPATAMYNIPSCGYNKEVQRFLDQVHGTTVALSGLQFFYVTRELVLTVAGTIVTYELVLLQFSVDMP